MQINADQELILTEKILNLEYHNFTLKQGEDDITMLYVQDHFICSAVYALTLSDEALQSLIEETIAT